MTDFELQKLVEKISEEVFYKPFRHRAYFNKRLRTTGGRYMLQTGHIEMNPLVYKKYGIEETVGVIQHELCHYHLHQEGKGYRHGDQDFKQLLARTNSPRYCRPLQERRESRRRFIYECTSCHQLYERKRTMDTAKYRCGICKSEIILREMK